MGKAYSVYLDDQEEKLMNKFCEEHGITPYKAFKIGFQQLLQIKEEGIYFGMGLKLTHISKEKFGKILQKEVARALKEQMNKMTPIVVKEEGRTYIELVPKEDAGEREKEEEGEKDETIEVV